MNPSQLGRIRTRHRWRACCRSGRCELRALQQVASVALADLARDHAGGHGLCLAREVATLLQSARPTHSLRHATASTAPPLACADERPRHRSTGPDAGVQPPATRVELEREHAERHAACELAYPHPAVGAYPGRRDCCGLADRVRSERAAQRLARCFPSHVRASIAHAASDATRSCEAPRDGRERACALRRCAPLHRGTRHAEAIQRGCTGPRRDWIPEGQEEALGRFWPLRSGASRAPTPVTMLSAPTLAIAGAAPPPL